MDRITTFRFISQEGARIHLSLVHMDIRPYWDLQPVVMMDHSDLVPSESRRIRTQRCGGELPGSPRAVNANTDQPIPFAVQLALVPGERGEGGALLFTTNALENGFRVRECSPETGLTQFERPGYRANFTGSARRQGRPSGRGG